MGLRHEHPNAISRRVTRVHAQARAARRRARRGRSVWQGLHIAGGSQTRQPTSWLNDLVFDRHNN